MADVPTTNTKSFFVDKKAIKRIVEETNRRVGFVKDPTATPQKARAMMQELGIRAEDNLASCGIIAARDEE